MSASPKTWVLKLIPSLSAGMLPLADRHLPSAVSTRGQLLQPLPDQNGWGVWPVKERTRMLMLRQSFRHVSAHVQDSTWRLW